MPCFQLPQIQSPVDRGLLQETFVLHESFVEIIVVAAAKIASCDVTFVIDGGLLLSAFSGSFGTHIGNQ